MGLFQTVGINTSIAVIAFGLTFALTPLFRRIFGAYGVVDVPDQARKTHTHPIPRGGGIAIAASWIASFFIARRWLGVADEQLSFVWKVLPAACVIFTVGIIDDFWGLKPRQKLAGQIVAAGIACWSGILATDGSAVTEHTWWKIPAAIVWLLACTNGFNLIDGLDGLAAGAGLFATLAMFVIALIQGDVALAIAALPLAGCLIGFLWFNFNPATIFLGDSGSLLIGFLLGCFGLAGMAKSITPMSTAAPMIALSLPLGDTGIAIVRRFLQGQPIFRADRGHIHHRLLDRGLSPKTALAALYGFCFVASLIAVLQTRIQSEAIFAVLIAGFLSVAYFGATFLGYTALSLAGRRTVPQMTALQRSTTNLRAVAGSIRMAEAGAGLRLIPTHMLITDEVRWQAASHRPTGRGARGSRRGDWTDLTGIPE